MGEVYENLQDFNLGDRVQKLEEENKRLSELILVLQADVEKLCATVMKMKQIQDNLATNISELYKTAKAEIERKDRMILELRRELDNYIFRRTKQFHSITGKSDVNFSSDSFEQKHCNKDVPLNLDHSERINLKHDENLQSSIINNQEKNEKISVNVKCDVNIKPHEKYYHPVLEDIDPYIPDNRRYRVGVKRDREEKIDRDLDEQTKKKIKYSEYARKYRNKISHRSGSREHEKSDNSKYDEWQYSEDRKRNEAKRYSDRCSYTEKHYKNDRMFTDVSRCIENNKNDDRRYADDCKHGSRWHTDERRFSGDIKYRDRRRSTESKIRTQRFERKVKDEVGAEVPDCSEGQSKSLQDKTKITNKEKSKIPESSDNTSHDIEDLSQSDIIQDLVEKQKKTMLMPTSTTKSKSSKSKDSKKDKTKQLTIKDNKTSELTSFGTKGNKKNKHDEIKASGTIELESVDCLNTNRQQENKKHSEIVTKELIERIETPKTVSNLKLLESQSSIESKSLQENSDTTHNVLQKVTERLESSQTLTVTSEIKHEKQNEVKTIRNTVACTNNNSKVVNESPIEKSVGNKNIETYASHETVNSSFVETKRKRRCVITIQ